MTADGRIVQASAFVSCGAGFRFRIVSEPACGPARGTIVFVHAFAEEMNKSRRMTARTARALALQGWRVVQRDLHGCGDSSGDFGDATWNDWVRDVEDELSAVPAGSPRWLWCHRAGALLATEALERDPDLNLLLWQPAVSGSQQLQQFLRLHAGARIVGAGSSDGPSPMQRLRAGETVEVGGYQIHPALAAGMEGAALKLPGDHRGHVVWLEVTMNQAPELSPAARRTIGDLLGHGIRVDAAAVPGPPFWQTQEIEDCDALLSRTLAAMGAGAPATSPGALEVS